MADEQFPAIPGYTIKGELGAGGFARVYLAEQQSLHRDVAVKVMDAALSQDEQFTQRFLREARVVANLAHQNIITVHEVGVHEGVHYIAMEHLPGGDLKALIERGHGTRPGLEPTQALRVLREVGLALGAAESDGFVHRDVKPHNILFRRDGSAVLMDFGIAKAVDDSTRKLTQTGTVIGTPQYMSPEQVKGLELDGRSDIYSLGIVFYEMLTGEVPFSADSLVAILYAHLEDPPSQLPGDLSRYQPLLDAMLAKDREQRIQSGDELARRIDELLAGGGLPTAPVQTPDEDADATIVRQAPDMAALSENRRVDGLAEQLEQRDAGEAPRRSGSSLVVGVLLLIGVAVAAAWFYFDPQAPVDDHSEADPMETVSTERAPAAAEPAEEHAPTETAAEPEDIEAKAFARLRVMTSPADAKVRVLNIRERYQTDMRLAPGDYRIEVSAPGYETQERVVTHTDDMSTPMFTLVATVEPDEQPQQAKQSETAADFLARNGGRSGVISTPSGLQYEVLRQSTGDRPGAKDEVTAHYVGSLTDGTVFDSSRDRGAPGVFPVDALIKGWQEGLQLMSVGSRYRFFVPPELGYGSRGSRAIPPDSALIFDVELLGVKRAGIEHDTAATAANRVRVDMVTSYGIIGLEVDRERAPLTVSNFLDLVQSGFYEGLTFHRVIPNFMIQGGGLDAKLARRPPPRTVRNESSNGLSNARGTLSMARMSDPDSADSQFFINVADNSYLDGQSGKPGYTVFGRVVSGEDVVQTIARSTTGNRNGMSDVPVSPVVIEKMRVR